MGVAVTIEALPALYGDCLWVECTRERTRPWRMVVDGGPPDATALAAKVDALPPGDRIFDLVVVTHIDSDHIGGLLPLLERSDLSVGDVWFNALPQLPDEGERATRSVAEGEDLVKLLSGITRAEPLPWNAIVSGRAIATPGDRTFSALRPTDGPEITLLSPTPKRLTALRRTWQQALAKVRRGEPEEGEPPSPREPLDDLRALAGTVTANDTSRPNGSSIAFLLEHRGASCLLAADAFPTVLGSALWALANARGGRPVEIDVVKVPHHGSTKNVTSKLLELVPADHYLVSTNGDRFGHPDDIALARVITAAPAGAKVWFNYDPTPSTARWSDAALTGRYDYETRFPLSPLGGARIELPERDR